MMKNTVKANIPNGRYAIRRNGSDSLVSMLPMGNDVSLLPGHEAADALWEMERQPSGNYTVRDVGRNLFLSHVENPTPNSPVIGTNEHTEWCLEQVKKDQYIFSVVRRGGGSTDLIMGISPFPMFPPRVVVVPCIPGTEDTWVLQMKDN